MLHIVTSTLGLRRRLMRLGSLWLLIGLGLLLAGCGSGGSGTGPGGNGPPSCDVSVASGDCDSDGVLNGEDEFPTDASRSCMVDNENRGSETADCDNDDVLNSEDEFPEDASRSCTVTDENSGSGTMADCDNDGRANDMDNCPAVANSDQTNTDGDDLGGDACDTNDDNDEHLDTADVDDDNDGLIEIATAAELDNVRHNLMGTNYRTSAGDSGDDTGCPTSGCAGYELSADIDLISIANWRPIGASDSAPFLATFDGNGFRVSNMVIDTNSGDRIGLFGTGSMLGSSVTIRNLHVSGSIVYRGAASARIGGLMGYLRGSASLVDGCSSAVDITGGSDTFQFIGGLIGRSQAGVQNSWAIGAVHSCGGDPTDRGSCEATGCSCSGGGSIGGLVGQSSSGRIRNSYATGDVRGNGTGLTTGTGGLIGSSTASTEDSYATGDVVGGSGADNIGGLVGYFSSSVDDMVRSYATGRVDDGDGDSATADNIGGLVGRTHGSRSISASYYSGMVNSISIGGGGATGDRVSGAVDAAQIPPMDPAALQTPPSVGGIYGAWSSRNWDFGTASQFPALKSFVDNNNDGANEEGVLLCGQEAPRAQCSS